MRARVEDEASGLRASPHSATFSLAHYAGAEYAASAAACPSEPIRRRAYYRPIISARVVDGGRKHARAYRIKMTPRRRRRFHARLAPPVLSKQQQHDSL